MNNWKTSALGVFTILGAAAHMGAGLINGDPMNMADLNAIMAGVGLLFAKDSNVTGGNVRQ